MLATKAWGPVRVVHRRPAEARRRGRSAPSTPRSAPASTTRARARPARPIAGALEDVGLPADLIDYADSDAYDAELRASHKEGIDKVGQDVGTPVIAVPGADGEQIAFFGPVVTPAPKGEEAAKLWDGTLLVASIPGFYEIKRTRTAGPDFSNL